MSAESLSLSQTAFLFSFYVLFSWALLLFHGDCLSEFSIENVESIFFFFLKRSYGSRIKLFPELSSPLGAENVIAFPLSQSAHFFSQVLCRKSIVFLDSNKKPVWTTENFPPDGDLPRVPHSVHQCAGHMSSLALHVN